MTAAIEDMVETTSTKRAPWHLVLSNNKPFGRLAAFRVTAGRLSKYIVLEPRDLDPNGGARRARLVTSETRRIAVIGLRPSHSVCDPSRTPVTSAA